MQPATPTAPIVTRGDLDANVISFAPHAGGQSVPRHAADLPSCHQLRAPRGVHGAPARQLEAGYGGQPVFGHPSILHLAGRRGRVARVADGPHAADNLLIRGDALSASQSLAHPGPMLPLFMVPACTREAGAVCMQTE